MAFNTSGFVLRPPRIATGNARTTGEADSGVVRDHKDLPGAFTETATFVEATADQYRAAVLDNPNGTEDEFLVWAANTSSLSLLPGESYTIEGDTVAPATFWWTRNDRRVPGRRPTVASSHKVGTTIPNEVQLPQPETAKRKRRRNKD